MTTLRDIQAVVTGVSLETLRSDVLGLNQGGLPLDFGGYPAVEVPPQVAQESATMHHLPPSKEDDPDVMASLTFKDGVYRLSLPGYYLDDSGNKTSNIAAVCMWLLQLTENDVVEVSCRSGRGLVGVGGGMDYLIWYVPVMNAIYSSKAKTTFVLDHFMSTYEPYMAMACTTVRVTEFAGILLTANAGFTDIRECERAIIPFLHKLLSRGVGHGLITEDERQAVMDLRTVSVSNKTLRSRFGMPGHTEQEESPTIRQTSIRLSNISIVR